MYISLLYQHATHNVLFNIRKVRLRSIETANNAKIYKVSKSAKSTQYMCLEQNKEPYDTALVDSQTSYVAASLIIDRQTDTTNNVTLTHAPRVN